MISEENIFIPFATSGLPKGPWLVFSPHADDETFGMGGTLIKAAFNGIETHLVVLTDGSLGGEMADLVATRKEEVTRVSAALGLATLDCWMEQDRSLNLRDELVLKILKKIRNISPAAVFFPGPMEPHPDHRNAALLVWAALQNMDQKERPAAYSYEISVQSPINLLIDISQQYDEKCTVMALYSSQNSENNYEELVRALNKARTFSLPKGIDYAEGFYLYKQGQIACSLQETLVNTVACYLKQISVESADL